MTAFLDPPPTPQERARAFLDVIFRRLPRREDLATPEVARRTTLLRREFILKLAPKTWLDLRREDFATPEAANRTLWLRGEVIAAFFSETPLGKCIADFHNAIRQRDLPAARQLQAKLKEVALATRPEWDWEPAFALHARLVDALAEGRMPDEEPPDIGLLTALWMGDSPDVAKLLDGLGYNVQALRFEERPVAKTELGEQLGELLTSALYVAKGDIVPDALRRQPFGDIGRDVRHTQRAEVLGELPEKKQQEVKPEQQRKFAIESYDPALHDSFALPSSEESSTTSSVRAERLEEMLPNLTPAQKDAVLQAHESACQGRDLTEYWGGKNSKEYRRKIKALERAKKRIQEIASNP